MTAPLIETLRGIVGEGNVLTDRDLGAWEQDWRLRVRGRALAVVRPNTTAQIVETIRACAAVGAAIVPQGGNTGLVAGTIPDDSGTQVVLSLTRMSAIREIDPDNLTMTVDAGCVLQAVQQVAEEPGFLFPLSLAAEGSCTIGGNLATNAGGSQVLRYGNARDLCLGLEVVTARGEVWDGLGGCAKTTPAMTCAAYSSEAKERLGSSPPRPSSFTRFLPRSSPARGSVRDLQPSRSWDSLR